MTTIAYKDGVIAYDSRATRGELIATDNADKCKVVGGIRFFMCGAVCDFDHIIQGYLHKAVPPKEADVGAFIVDKGKVYRAGCSDGEFWYHEVEPSDAIGSGTQHALTAMDMGADAVTAVKMAAKRDVNTGGKIRSYKVPK